MSMGSIERKPDRESRRDEVAHLRATATEQVDRTSLRATARSIGVSPWGLRMFLDGSAPRVVTLRRLREWYFVQVASTGALSTVAARTAISALVEGMSEKGRPATARAVVLLLIGAHTGEGTDPPGWLVEISQEHGIV